MSKTKSSAQDKADKPAKKTNVKAMVQGALFYSEKGLAFVTLIVSSAYGFRQGLQKLEDIYAFIITGIVIALLVGAILRKR